METDGKKECSDNEDSVNSHGAIFDGKKKLMSSKSISAQNLSEFSTKRERPLIRSHTTDAQDCNTLVGDIDEDLFHESIQPSDRLIDHSFQSEDDSDEQSKLLMRKNRSNLIVKDSADRYHLILNLNFNASKFRSQILHEKTLKSDLYIQLI